MEPCSIRTLSSTHASYQVSPAEGQTWAEIRVKRFEHSCIHNEDFTAFPSTAPNDRGVTLCASEKPVVPVMLRRS